MEKNKIHKRYLVLYISIAVLLISITFKVSYSYFVANVRGSGTSTVISAGDLKLEFQNNQYIDADDLVILSNDEIEAQAKRSTFDVVNTGSVTAYYDLYFDTTLTNNLISSDFKWELLVNNVSISNGTFNTITKNTGSTSSTGSIKLTPSSLSLSSSGTSHCVLKIWLQERDANQIGLTEGTMNGHVRLQAITK